MSLQGKCVVITGGTGNLGGVVTQRFVAAGARVAVTYRSAEEWERLREALPAGVEVLGLPCDVTSAAEVEAAMATAAEKLGGLHVLLNLAGGYAGGQTVAEMDEAAWDKMMALNLKSAFLCTRYALPYMLAAGSGRLVNVSSKVALDHPAKSAAVAVSKAGLLTLTQCLATELRGTGVKAMAILPSIIDTPANRESMPKADPAKWVTPQGIAEVLVMLAGEAGGQLNGALLPVYGAL